MFNQKRQTDRHPDIQTRDSKEEERAEREKKKGQTA